MNRIHWTDDEKALVVEAMAEALQKQPRMRYAELWEAGNVILQPDRRRKWYSGYSGRMSKESNVFEEARKRASTPTTSWIAESLKDDERRAQQKQHIPMQHQQEVTWVPVPTPQTLAEVPLKELLAEVIERVLYLYAPKTATEWPEAPARQPQAMCTPKDRAGMAEVISKIRPIRIALCGPLKDQFNRVKERINGKKVELVHVDNQKSVDAQDWKGGIDYAVVTRFMRHAHSELANQYVGKERVHWVPQGTDSIVAKISELVPGSVN